MKGLAVSSRRSWGAGAALLGATVWFASILNEHYPLREWLFFRYAVCILATLGFCAACLSSGHAIVSLLSRPGERQDGHVTLSFATGVFAFFLLTFLVGLCHGFSGPAFFLIPLALFAVGARRLARDLLSWHERRLGAPWFPRFSVAEATGLGFGLVALVVLYVPILMPENTAYDSRWYHLGLAEHYVAAGAIERMPEGPVFGVVPHLASVLYTWAFLLPGSELFDRVELAAHLEFAIFVFTLPGICALTRYLVPGARARLAWLAIFFFPAIFLYDATLLAAADHVAALFSIPTYLLMVRAFRDLRPEACLLFAVQAAGLATSKYTAPLAAIFPVFALLGRAVWLGVSSLRRPAPEARWLAGPLVAFFATLLFSAPHWLKNWIWYGDPVYPILHRHLNLRPWTPDSAALYAVYESEAWRPLGSTAQRLKGAARALYDHSLALYNWPDFHGTFPIVGSLFTFGLVALPFVRARRRLLVLVLATHLAIFAWALMFAHERYLQALVPWMAAGVAALAIQAFELGFVAKAGVVLLGGLQLVWGLDMIFWPLHKMTGVSSMALASDFFGSAYRKQFEPRTRPFEQYAAVGRAIPKGSKLLLHHEHVRLGLEHQTVWDWPRFQYGISYGRLGNSRDLHRLLKQYGVTHVTWLPEKTFGDDSLASELVFHTYVGQYLLDAQTLGGRRVAKLPYREPPAERPLVLYMGCGRGPLADGLYPISSLHVSPLVTPGSRPREFPPPEEPLGDAAEQLSRVDRVIVDARCDQAPDLAGFERVARGGNQTFYARTP